MLKKLFILPLLLLLCVLPVFSSQAATKPEITSIRTATRNDANIPFFRTVLEVNGVVNPKLYIDKDGQYVFVTLPNTKVAKGVDKSLKTNKNIVSRMSLDTRSSGTDVTLRMPAKVTKNDLKVFTLAGSSKNTTRVVIDVNDKSGKVKQWSHWNDTSIGISNESKKQVEKTQQQQQKDKWNKQPAQNIPATNPALSYSLTQGLKGKIIAIDPGHGGSDTGAIGSYSQEKDITLAISKRLQTLLNDAGATVIMTRTREVDVYGPYGGAVEALQARANVANASKADVFVYIHIDSFDSPSAGGVTAFYNSKTPYDYSLAKYIHAENMEVTNFADRGVQTANFYVLLHTNMPATLLELGFISNPNEENALNTAEQQQKFAESIAKGLADYFNNGGK